MLEREDIEAVIACLGDDAAQLRDDNPEDERADNMDRAATMLRELADSNAAVARLLLDQNRDGAKGWARGLHINMDGEGGLTVSAASAVSPSQEHLDYLRACDAQNMDLLEAIGYPHEKDTMTSPEEYAADLKRKADAFDALSVSPSQEQSDAMPDKLEVPSTDASETVSAIYRALSRGNNRDAMALAMYYVHAKHAAERAAGIQSPAAPAMDPWRLAVDNELVSAHLGTTDSFPPEEGVRLLIDWHIAVACNPAVNGGYKLMRVQDESAAPVGGEVRELPETVRVPLDELEADARYLAARLANGTMAPSVGAEAIQRRTRAIREALLAAASVLEAQPPAPAGWWTEELERIFTASRGTVITDEMKRAAAIALHIARGQRWDDAKQEWTDGVLEAQPQPSDQGET